MSDGEHVPVRPTDRLAELEAENAFLRRALELAGTAMRAKDREIERERLRPDSQGEASQAVKLSRTVHASLQDLARIGAFDEIEWLRDMADELLPRRTPVVR